MLSYVARSVGTRFTVLTSSATFTKLSITDDDDDDIGDGR